ncbi:MAG TPA: transglycosylase SLT domain-containing protein [Vicinamibacterales bacterium]|nr:transglycosylase SLT domain-containing protein [Vicinamibacterales bacterium]
METTTGVSSAAIDFLPSSTIKPVPAALPVIAHELTVPLNQRVLTYISLFQGRMRDFIETGMKNGSKYLPMIQRVFTAQGLPPDLAYIPLVESAFRTEAMSKASARGVWQFMRGTAVENGLRNDWYVDERSNPEKATIAAANYLKSLSDTFNGDWQLALASYNSGPGRVQQAIKRVGVANFWSLAAKPSALPRETREYVPMILAAIVIARNPAQYGFSFESEEAPAYETIRLPRAVELKRVAEWIGSSVDALRELNPELRRPVTPIKDADYALRVPVGTSYEIARRIDESSGDDLVSVTRYTVKTGETLPAVARKLRISRADLAEANGLDVTSRLSAGQQLTVPADVPFVAYTETKTTAAKTVRKTTAKKSASN